MRAAAWGVHLLTATGAPAGLLAIIATIRGDAQAAFAWMAYTIAVDAIDGTLARRLQVKRRLPTIDGARLDDCVDYFTWVVTPAFFAVHMQLLPAALAMPVAAAMLVTSALGFARSDAKTSDHLFTGFPSYWNIVVFYLYVLAWPRWANAFVLAVLAAGVLVPIRYVYPSRTETLRGLNVTLGLVWAAALVWTIATLGRPSRAVVYASLLYPAYYVALSLVLSRRRAAGGVS